MNENKAIDNVKMIPITLSMLEKILEASEKLRKNYQNTNFNFIYFVARLISIEGDTLLFSDGTAFFKYNLRLNQLDLDLKPNYYYQCLCTLRSMGTSCRPDIINLRPVDGNFITIHIMRTIHKEYQNRTKQPIVAVDSDLTTQYGRADQIFEKMKHWSKKKSKFTKQELEYEFSHLAKFQFEEVLERIEEDGELGNMGEFYVWMH